MKKITLSATQVREKLFELIDAAKQENQIVDITKNGKIAARIVPADLPMFDWFTFARRANKVKGILNKSDEQEILEVRDQSKKTREVEW